MGSVVVTFDLTFRSRDSDDLPAQMGIREIEREQRVEHAHYRVCENARPAFRVAIDVADQASTPRHDDETVQVEKGEAGAGGEVNLESGGFQQCPDGPRCEMLAMTYV